MELYEHDDLDVWLATEQAHQLRLVAAHESGEIDDDTFRQADTARRFVARALEEAREIRSGRTERTVMYDRRVREAAQAVRQLKRWEGFDDDLRRLLDEQA